MYPPWLHFGAWRRCVDRSYLVWHTSTLLASNRYLAWHQPGTLVESTVYTVLLGLLSTLWIVVLSVLCVGCYATQTVRLPLKWRHCLKRNVRVTSSLIKQNSSVNLFYAAICFQFASNLLPICCAANQQQISSKSAANQQQISSKLEANWKQIASNP